MVVSTTAIKEARHNKKSAKRLRDTMPDPVAARFSSLPASMALIVPAKADTFVPN